MQKEPYVSYLCPVQSTSYRIQKAWSPPCTITSLLPLKYSIDMANSLQSGKQCPCGHEDHESLCLKIQRLSQNLFIEQYRCSRYLQIYQVLIKQGIRIYLYSQKEINIKKLFRSLLVPSGLCCFFFFSFVSKQCLLEEKHCCCIFQNKVLQLLMQTLIKCTSLNLIFAGVSCHFLTETVRQTST